MGMKRSRAAGFLIITAIYIMAVTAGVCTYLWTPGPWPVRLLVADVVATVFVFLTSLPLRNASVYDPFSRTCSNVSVDSLMSGSCFNEAV